MSPIQQMLLGVGASTKATYIDDIFSNYLWKGDGNSGRTITNNIDVSGEGALVWMKSRSTGHVNVLFDTERGANQRLRSDSDLAQNNTDTLQPSFTSSGFTVGSGNEVNGSGNDYTSWTFRKAPGFFTCLTYTGSSSARTISHDLGCVPGAIFIKKTSGSDYWAVYHEGLDSSSPEDYYLKLNTTDSRIDDANFWNDTKPTASVFSLGDAGAVNSDGHEYVAYLFGGGESGAATACSVNFNAGSDYLATQSSTYNFGTGDFTIEFWTKLDTAIGTNGTATPGFFQLGTSASLQDDFKWMSVRARNDSGGRWQMLIKSTSTTKPSFSCANCVRSAIDLY